MIPGIRTSVCKSLSFHTKSAVLLWCLRFIFHLSRWVCIFRFTLTIPFLSLKWLLRQYLAFSNRDLFSRPQSGGKLLGAVSTTSFFYFNILPHSLAHDIPPPSLSGIPIQSFIYSLLGLLAPLCPCNMTSGQHQQRRLLCFPFTEDPVTSTSCCCVRPCHTVTGTQYYYCRTEPTRHGLL